MRDRDRAAPGDLYCRIGSLEISNERLARFFFLYCRIGSLENCGGGETMLVALFRKDEIDHWAGGIPLLLDRMRRAQDPCCALFTAGRTHDLIMVGPVGFEPTTKGL